MAENEMAPNGAEAALNVPETLPESMTDWVQQRRAQTPPAEPTPAKPSSNTPARQRFRLLLVCLAFLSCGWFLYTYLNSNVSTVTGIQGQLVDPMHRPIAGARVFLESDPTFETVTDRNGNFCLSEMPLGRQVLVAALEDAGEEYSVKVVGATIIDMGSLVYHVPPQSVRRSPGGGYGWTGLVASKP
jgi:Carboxypeptidase regulatory-like domain